jgi:hypothetical protein
MDLGNVMFFNWLLTLETLKDNIIIITDFFAQLEIDFVVQITISEEMERHREEA